MGGEAVGGAEDKLGLVPAGLSGEEGTRVDREGGYKGYLCGSILRGCVGGCGGAELLLLLLLLFFMKHHHDKRNKGKGARTDGYVGGATERLNS